MPTKPRSTRPQLEDYLRAVGYLNISIWAVVFYLFPPSAFLSQLAELSRILWLSVAFIGGIMAAVGVIKKIDIKLEFPGLLLAVVGPIFYALSQLYLVLYPIPDNPASQRVALVFYAFLGVTLLLPQAVHLLKEKNKAKGSVK